MRQLVPFLVLSSLILTNAAPEAGATAKVIRLGPQKKAESLPIPMTADYILIEVSGADEESASNARQSAFSAIQDLIHPYSEDRTSGRLDRAFGSRVVVVAIDPTKKLEVSQRLAKISGIARVSSASDVLLGLTTSSSSTPIDFLFEEHPKATSIERDLVKDLLGRPEARAAFQRASVKAKANFDLNAIDSLESVAKLAKTIEANLERDLGDFKAKQNPHLGQDAFDAEMALELRTGRLGSEISNLRASAGTRAAQTARSLRTVEGRPSQIELAVLLYENQAGLREALRAEPKAGLKLINELFDLVDAGLENQLNLGRDVIALQKKAVSAARTEAKSYFDLMAQSPVTYGRSVFGRAGDIGFYRTDEPFEFSNTYLYSDRTAWTDLLSIAVGPKGKLSSLAQQRVLKLVQKYERPAAELTAQFSELEMEGDVVNQARYAAEVNPKMDFDQFITERIALAKSREQTGRMNGLAALSNIMIRATSYALGQVVADPTGARAESAVELLLALKNNAQTNEIKLRIDASISEIKQNLMRSDRLVKVAAKRPRFTQALVELTNSDDSRLLEIINDPAHSRSAEALTCSALFGG